MTLLRVALVLGAGVLAALIVRAGLTASFGASFAAIAADPWGLVSLVDLYLGFAAFAVVIAAVERALPAVILIVLLLVLGNLVGALWLAWRAGTIVQRLNAVR